MKLQQIIANITKIDKDLHECEVISKMPNTIIDKIMFIGLLLC